MARAVVTASRPIEDGRRHVAPIAFIALIGSIIAIGALALVGTGMQIQALTADRGDEAHPRISDVGEPIRTSFGTLTIERIGALDGLSAQDLGGMTHGVQGLVTSGEEQLAVSILLVNESARPVSLDPAQFRLIVAGAAAPLPPTGSTMRPVTLRPGTRIEGTVAFVTARTGVAVSVAYADPGGPQIVAPAGLLGAAPIGLPAHDDNGDHGTTP